MRVITAIARRELRGLLRGPSGWLVLAGFLLLAGVFWVVLVDGYVAQRTDLVIDPHRAARTTLVDHLLAPWWGNLAVLLIVVGPAVTMGSLAEESRTGRRDLFATAPIAAGQIVAGKFLGAFAYVACLLLATSWMPLSLGLWTPLDPGALAAGYGGLLLLAASVVALGLLASSLTDRQLVALILGFAVVMALWVVGWVDRDPTSLAAQASMSAHLRDLLLGSLRASDVAYYLLLTGWSLFATWQRVDAWRYA